MFTYHYNNLNRRKKKDISIEKIIFVKLEENQISKEFLDNLNDISIFFLSEKILNSEEDYFFSIQFKCYRKEYYMYSAYKTITENKQLSFDIENKTIIFKDLCFTVFDGGKSLHFCDVDFLIKFTEYGWKSIIKFFINYFVGYKAKRELLN